MNKKIIKIGVFDKNTPPSIVKTRVGDAILDSICLNATTNEDLETGEYYLDCTFLIDKECLHTYLQEEAILKVQMDYGNEYFVIAKIRKSSKNIVVFARQLTIAETLDLWLEDVRPEKQNGQGALSWIFNFAKGKKDIRISSDISTISTAYYMDMSMYKALHDCDQSFTNRWGGEIQRRGYDLTINKRIGKHRGVQIRSRKNLTGFEANTDIDKVVTRIKPKGFNGITIDGYVDSPLINTYRSIKTREIKYEDVKVKDENNQEGFDTLKEAQQELIRRANLEFTENNIDKIRADYRINFVQLEQTEEYKNYVQSERVYLGDELDVYEEKLDINITVRSVRRKFDVLRQRVLEIELANEVKKDKPTTINDVLNGLDKIENEVVENNKWFENAINNATDLIENGLKDSYVIVRKNEILIMDTKDINTAINVWRWNSGGLAHSKTGYYGEYETAITQDGSIVAKFITGLIVNGEQINTRNFVSIDNKDKVTFQINNEGNCFGDFTELYFQNERIEQVVASSGNLIPNTDLKEGLSGWSSTDNSYLVLNEGNFTDMIDYKNQMSKTHFIYGYPNGQSDCQLIETVTGKTILIDAGLEEQGGSFVKYIKDLGITRLDYVFATHAHSDHIGGMPAIIDAFDIGVFYGVNPDPSILDQEEIHWETMKYWQRVKDALHRKGMDVTWPTAGIQLSKYDRLDVYNIKEPTPKMNDMSLVLKYTHMSSKIVLSGDVEFADEERIASQIGKVDVLKLGHHGLDTSTGYEYIDKLKPNMTIFTTTANLASQRIPVLTRLQLAGITKNLTLGTQGTIVITSDGTKYASSFNQDFSLYNKWGKAYNKDYFFDWGGKPVNDFRTIYSYDTRNVDYYFSNNEMKVGWIEISQGTGKLSKWYYASDGLDGTYYIGELVKGFYEVSWNGSGKEWYYFDENTHEMLRAKWVKHNDNYWYYLKDNGVMARSETLWIEDGYYTFDANGRMQ
ncbi:phage tail spike protein [Paeniclostridium hominis]|uniref:phage tail spike protein n=1 Tax=Paeniclostridium hominis TaxID=2764329 RepID=UPI0022E3C0BC|nr:phage tail spike protein [Paeniclostridium hominis]